MNKFKGLCLMSGLHVDAAAQFLNVEQVMIRAWAEGRIDCPEGVIHEIMGLVARQEAAIEKIQARQISIYDEIGCPANDHDAQKLGWPSFSVWHALETRALNEIGKPVHREYDPHTPWHIQPTLRPSQDV